MRLLVPVYVDDVFSTFTYEGNGGTTTVNNGIDLSGNLALDLNIQIPLRNHRLGDTGVDEPQVSYKQFKHAETTNTNIITSYEMEFWLWHFHKLMRLLILLPFRKAPGFFDIQTFTASPGTNTISHSLGTTPGMMIIKTTSQAENWWPGIAVFQITH